jgi:hypothetical protein
MVGKIMPIWHVLPVKIGVRIIEESPLAVALPHARLASADLFSAAGFLQAATGNQSFLDKGMP